MSRKNRITAYYQGYLHQGQAGYVRILNFLVYRFLVLLGAFIFFLYFTDGQQPLAVFWAAFSVLLIYHFGVKYHLAKKLVQLEKEVNEQIAEEEYQRRLKALDKEGFNSFIYEVLTNLPGFSQLELTSHLESEGIDLIGKYYNQLVAIQCHTLDGDNAVESRNARELSKAMSRRNYQKGIIISTTDFRDDTKYFCNLIKAKRQIVLLGYEELVQMTKEAHKYPREDEVKDLLLKKIEHQRRTFHNSREKVFAKPRLGPYFIYGTILLILGIIFNFGIKYLYFLGAGALYSLGFIGLKMSLNKKHKNIKWGWQMKLATVDLSTSPES